MTERALAIDMLSWKPLNISQWDKNKQRDLNKQNIKRNKLQNKQNQPQSDSIDADDLVPLNNSGAGKVAVLRHLEQFYHGEKKQTNCKNIHLGYNFFPSNPRQKKID